MRGFYAEMGVRELLVVDPATARVELFVLSDDALHAVPAGADRSVTAESLGVTFSTGAGGHLRLDWVGGTAEI